MNIIRRYREHAVRKRATREIIEQTIPEEVSARQNAVFNAALNGLESSDWLFPSQKPHKMHHSEVEQYVRNMGEELRSIRSHLVGIAIQATALKQFCDEFPEDYVKLPESLRQQADVWISLLRFDESSPNVQKYQEYINRRNDDQPKE